MKRPKLIKRKERKEIEDEGETFFRFLPLILLIGAIIFAVLAIIHSYQGFNPDKDVCLTIWSYI